MHLKGSVSTTSKAVGRTSLGSLDLYQADWRDWIQDELNSLSGDERVEILIASLKHNNMNSLMAMRDLSVQTRFRLADEMRDCADKMEHMSCEPFAR